MVETLVENIIIFIVLLNPTSKITLLASIEEEVTPALLVKMSKQATITAICILVAFAFTGIFLLNTILRIELTALQTVGGIVLFMVGLRAMQKGEFFPMNTREF